MVCVHPCFGFVKDSFVFLMFFDYVCHLVENLE